MMVQRCHYNSSNSIVGRTVYADAVHGERALLCIVQH